MLYVEPFLRANKIDVRCIPEDPLTYQPLFETRHTFMQTCQAKHWQFDTLRRAKHATMCILFHLNAVDISDPTLNKCGMCKKEITNVRWYKQATEGPPGEHDEIVALNDSTPPSSKPSSPVAAGASEANDSPQQSSSAGSSSAPSDTNAIPIGGGGSVTEECSEASPLKLLSTEYTSPVDHSSTEVSSSSNPDPPTLTDSTSSDSSCPSGRDSQLNISGESSSQESVPHSIASPSQGSTPMPLPDTTSTLTTARFNDTAPAGLVGSAADSATSTDVAAVDQMDTTEDLAPTSAGAQAEESGECHGVFQPHEEGDICYACYSTLNDAQKQSFTPFRIY